MHVRRNAAHVDAYVAKAVIKRMSRPDVADLFAAPTPDVDVKALRREVTALQTQLGEWDTDRTEGRVTRARWLAQTKLVNDKLTKIQSQLAAVTDVSPVAPLVGAEDVRAAWDTLSLGRQRAIVADLMAVTILPTTRKGRGFDRGGITVEPKV